MINTLKKSILGGLLLTPLLLIGTKNVQASTVATVHSDVRFAKIYTQNGTLVTNRALGANTPWLVGKTITLKDRPFYQVATNEYVDSQVVDISGNQNNSNNETASTKLVGYAKKVTYLVNSKGETIQNRALGSNTYWQVGKVIQNKNRQVFYQVATNEYVKKDDMSLNKEPTIESIDDFGIVNGSTSDNKNNDVQMNNDQKGNDDSNKENDNTSNTPVVSKDGYSITDKNMAYKPIASQSEMAQAIVDAVNVERAKNGLYALKNDNAMINKVALLRGKEATIQPGHIRPNGARFDQAYQDFMSIDDTVMYPDASENVMPLGDGTYDTNHLTLKGLATMSVEGYRGEPDHWNQMMTTTQKYIGVGVGYDYSMHCYFIVQEFCNYDPTRAFNYDSNN